MATEDLARQIAEIRAKIEVYQNALAGLEALYALETGGSVPSGGGGSVPREIEPTTFWGKTIPDATRTFLSMVNKRPQTTAQIADALKQGGMQTNSKDFTNTVQTILRRHENQTDEIIRVPGGAWALAEWFPDRPRRRRTKGKMDEGTGEGGDAEDGQRENEPAPTVKGSLTRAVEAERERLAKESAPASSPNGHAQP